MPTQRFEGTLAAASSISNLLAGSKFENLPWPSAIAVYAVQDGAGAGKLICDVTMGNSIEIDGAAVQTTAVANDGPNRNQHLLGSGVAARHDRVQIKLTNNDAALGSNYRVLVEQRRIGR